MIGPRQIFSRKGLLSTVFFDPRFPAIGPHEGREAFLLGMGWKAAALFGDVAGQPITPEETAVIKLVDAGQADVLTFEFSEYHVAALPFFIRYACYFLNGHNDVARTVQAALSSHMLSADSPATHLEFMLGRALGYSDKDILTFVIRSARHF